MSTETSVDVFDVLTPEDFGEDDTPTVMEVKVHDYENEDPVGKSAPDGSTYQESRYTKGKRVGIVFIGPVMNMVELVSYYKGDRTKDASAKAVCMDTWVYEDANGKKISVDQTEENARMILICQWSEVDKVVFKLQYPKKWGITDKDELDAAWDKLCDMYETALKAQGLKPWDADADPDAPLHWRVPMEEPVVTALVKKLKRNKELTHNLFYIKADEKDPSKPPYRSIYGKLDNFVETDDDGTVTENRAQFIIGRQMKDASGNVILNDDGEPMQKFDVLPWESLEEKRAQGRPVFQIRDHFDGISTKNRMRIKGVKLVTEPGSGGGRRIGMGRLMQLDGATAAQTSKASSAIVAALGATADAKPIKKPVETTDDAPPARRRPNNRTGGLRAALDEGATDDI